MKRILAGIAFALALVLVPPTTWYLPGTNTNYRIGKPPVDEFGVSSGAASSTLLTSLVSYWKLDELSGTRASAAGSCASCDLSAVNSPLAMGGSGSYALHLAPSSGTYVKSTNAALQLTAGTARAFAAWFTYSGTGSNLALVEWSNATGDGNPLWLVNTTSGASPQLQLFQGGNYRYTSAAITSSTRHLLYVATDASGNWKASLDGVAPTTGTNTDTNVGATLAVGAGYSIPWEGSIGPAMYWTTPHSSADIAAIYNGGSGYSCSALPAGLLTNLTACWDLSEASGTRAASNVGSCTTNCDLTPNGTPGRSAGLVPNSMGISANFVGASSQTLSLSDNADISMSTKMGLSFWANLPSFAVDKAFVGKWTYQTDGGWAIQTQASSGTGISVYIATSNTDAGSGCRMDFSDATVSSNVWTHVVLGYDGTLSGDANRLKVYTQGVSRTLAAGSGAVPATLRNDGSPLLVAEFGGSLHRYQTGSIDALGMWSRTLTQSEITALYASGSGVEYPWSSITDMFQPSGFWADRSLESKQRAIYAKTGVYVPDLMFPSARVIALR